MMAKVLHAGTITRSREDVGKREKDNSGHYKFDGGTGGGPKYNSVDVFVCIYLSIRNRLLFYSRLTSYACNLIARTLQTVDNAVYHTHTHSSYTRRGVRLRNSNLSEGRRGAATGVR